MIKKWKKIDIIINYAGAPASLETWNKKLPDISRSKIQNLIKLGQVTINGEPVKSSLILQGNEAIECKFQAKIKSKF